MAGWGHNRRPNARVAGWRRTLAVTAAGLASVSVVGAVTVTPTGAGASPLDPAAGRSERGAAACRERETRVDRVRHRFAQCVDGRFEWREVVLAYGDSLSAQAAPYVKYYFENDGQYFVVERNFGGTAPCDWKHRLRSDIGRYAPSAVIYQFSGNLLSNCMAVSRAALLPSDPAVAPDPEPYYEQYERDTRWFVRVARSRRIATFIASAPPAADFVDAANGWGRLDDIYRQVATEEHAMYMPQTRIAVAAADGTRIESLPCLAIEPCAGAVQPGHNALFGPDRGHFGCAVPVPPPVRGVTARCPAHSSGALRYGLAMVTVVRSSLEGRSYRATRVPRSLIGR